MLLWHVWFNDSKKILIRSSCYTVSYVFGELLRYRVEPVDNKMNSDDICLNIETSPALPPVNQQKGSKLERVRTLFFGSNVCTLIGWFNNGFNSGKFSILSHWAPILLFYYFCFYRLCFYKTCVMTLPLILYVFGVWCFIVMRFKVKNVYSLDLTSPFLSLLRVPHRVNGTEWPLTCWCAVKKLLTHSLVKVISAVWQWVSDNIVV